jgi:basic amino acid/polyamine antiporter, APA family
MQPSQDPSTSPQLIRGMSLGSATALNMLDMIGVGPFITMPLILSAMGGPQAMLGWIVGALFAVCDGLVWAELGAAMPHSGGSYYYLREIYGPQKLGRLISFLFVWQVSFSAPLSIATGCIGLAGYAAYYFPHLETVYASHTLALPIPWAGSLQVSWLVTPGTAVAVGACLLAIFLLYRRITALAKLTRILWVCVMGTIGWIIFAGLTHFNATRAFDFPPGAFTLSRGFFIGLGGAMLISTYDYWGYYNVCFLGAEIEDPGKNIPRALLLSIALVAGIYLVMNICILAVVPWRDLAHVDQNGGLYVVSLFMQRVYGAWAARVVTALVMLTAFASVFSLMLGYSRVPYAAARDGNYFRVFAKMHPVYRFPHVSLVTLGLVAAAFCFLRLKDAIAALVVIRILLQFIVQAVGVIVLRVRRPDMPRPFRMWFYPLPALLAICGFLFVLFNRANAMKEVRYAAVILLAGLIVYFVRAWRNGEWPFRQTLLAPPQLPTE